MLTYVQGMVRCCIEIPILDGNENLMVVLCLLVVDMQAIFLMGDMLMPPVGTRHIE